MTSFCSALNVLAGAHDGGKNRCRTLRHLDIAGTPLLFSEPALLEGLARCLAGNRSLEHVDVSLPNESIPEPALQYLARHCLCRAGPSLTTFVLFREEETAAAARLDVATVDAIVDGMGGNTSLLSLGRTAGNHRIQHWLDMNRAGRRALATLTTTNTTNTSLGIWSHLLARAARPATITAGDGPIDHDDDDDDEGDARDRGRVASVLFGLLQGPALLEQR